MKKRKVIVLTDISTTSADRGEPDDTQSLVRFLLYSEQFDILGFVATYTNHLNRAAPEMIHHVLEGYRSIYSNLRKSGGDFAAPDKLHAIVWKGSDQYGAELIGHESEGARHIVDCVDQSAEPVWILIWGGSLDLAQALRIAGDEKTEEEFSHFLGKLRVYAIGDQYDDCGATIRLGYPKLFYITSYHAYRGMYRGGDPALCDDEWVKAHIQSETPFGSYYPCYNGGDTMSGVLGKVKGVKEGDSPSLLYLIQNGLNNPERPEYGGWGGRFMRAEGTQHYFDTYDHTAQGSGPWECVYRWRDDFQTDFAARMMLASGKTDQLHYPQIPAEMHLCCKPGDRLTLELPFSENANTDWIYYPEAGTYRGPTLLLNKTSHTCMLYLPARNHIGAIHIIAKVRCAEAPIVSKYCRMIITVTEDL